MRRGTEDRPRQLPWIVVGLTITLTTAIIFALWASSLSNRTAVAVAARDIPAGSELALNDFRAVEMAISQGASYVPISKVGSLTGRVLRTAIPKGAIFHPELVSEHSNIADDQVIVGAVLEPGEYPVAHLNAGQTVGIIIANDANNAAEDRRWASTTQLQATNIRADVAEVTQMPDSARGLLFVSLMAAATDAEIISQAAASGELRLILLPQDAASASTDDTTASDSR